MSHSESSATNDWLASMGGAWSLRVVSDPDRVSYFAWGLGRSSYGYLLNPWTANEMRKLAQEGIAGAKIAEDGDRWQMAGYWAVDGQGKIACGGRAERPEEVFDLKGAANVLGFRE